MAAKANLKYLGACESYTGDGLWDIALGYAMLMIAILFLTGSVWGVLMFLPLLVILPLGKILVTIPRIGYVKIRTKQERRQEKVAAVILIATFATFGVLVIALYGTKLGNQVWRATIGCAFVLFCGTMGYFTDSRRLYVYGLFSAASTVVWELLGAPAGPIAFAVLGSIALAIGLVIFVRFLRKPPKPPADACDVGE